MMSSPNPGRQRSPLYRLLFSLHLYAGLLAGFFVVIIALSGSVIVYWRELDELLNPGMQVVSATGPVVGMDQVVQTLRKDFPGHTGVWRIKTPRREGAPFVAEYYDPPERSSSLASYVLIDPYTGLQRSTWYWNETLVSWIYTLHMYLQIGSAGHHIVGWMGILLLLMTLSGLYLWWPPRFGRSAFLMDLRSDWPRFEFDSHRLAGLYSLVVILVVTVTGINIVYPRQVRAVLGVVSPVHVVPDDLRSAALPDRAPITASTAVDVALRAFPGARLHQLMTPSGSDGLYRVILRQEIEVLNKNLPQTQVWIDQYTGGFLHVRDPARFNSGTALDSLTYALHNGEAFGEPGKIVVFLTGPVLLWLYVTGVTRWLRKRKLQSARAAGARRVG
jgi:uncharacterized iron-regulated membrane protein